jgi:glycosyltransferase involved in cell wall biosynthesis
MTDHEDEEHNGPLAFFDIVVHFGGSYQSLAVVLTQLTRRTNVVFIDAYGVCSNFHNALKAGGVPSKILFQNWSGRTTIGGDHPAERVMRILFATWNILRLVIRLRRELRRCKPRALSVTNEKSLFIAWLAAPRGLPIVFHLRTELRKVNPVCIPAWFRAAMVISVSHEGLNYLIATKYAHRNLIVVHNGIDVDETLARSSSGGEKIPDAENNGLRIVFPASFGSALKGHETGIRAFHAYCKAGGNASLWLCGDVPTGAPTAFYDQMRQLVLDLGLGNSVHFLGWRTDILAVMRRCDIVLLPSYTEGMPRSLLEAMALSKPIVTTRVGGVPELVRHGTDGFVLEPGDVDGIVNALRRLEDPRLRSAMGASGFQRVKEDFSLDSQVNGWLQAYRSLMT